MAVFYLLVLPGVLSAHPAYRAEETPAAPRQVQAVWEEANESGSKEGVEEAAPAEEKTGDKEGPEATEEEEVSGV